MSLPTIVYLRRMRIKACLNVFGARVRIPYATEADSEYRLSLGLSNSFDEALKESMQRSLFSFFVMNVTAKWYTFTNKEEAAGYATEAATYMEDIMRKAFFKRKPTRPTYE